MEMQKYAMLIDYGYCTGCRSCEISCRKEHGLSLKEWGIAVQEIGPKKLKGEWEWDYVPVPSRLCDLCEGRRSEGKKPLCELHCLANVINVIPVAEVSEKMLEAGDRKISCFIP
ncbi:oxidoreductase [Adlercreutzia sp. ZJ154]|uniref:oxidoreductase n=1 Tax=Adlercreutzia sp. ZJ154 TaxID=2709790 RepID=UPI001F151882|nr:oxidoreductase [Adlercreutzia sp. ZJ154]